MLSRYGVGTYTGNKLLYNSSGNTPPQSSQLPELPWTDLGPKNGIGACELMSITKEKRKRKRRRRIIFLTFLQNPCVQGKAAPHRKKKQKEKEQQ